MWFFLVFTDINPLLHSTSTPSIVNNIDVVPKEKKSTTECINISYKSRIPEKYRGVQNRIKKITDKLI